MPLAALTIPCRLLLTQMAALSLLSLMAGLPADSMESCFNKYKTSGGTGLGLYLTKLQVEQLGGRVDVSSPWSPDYSGTEFKLTIPLRLSTAPAAGATAAQEAAGETERAPPPEEELRVPKLTPGLRVLVADDIRLNRTILKRTFVSIFGWVVEEACTAEDALAVR